MWEGKKPVRRVCEFILTGWRPSSQVKYYTEEGQHVTWHATVQILDRMQKVKSFTISIIKLKVDGMGVYGERGRDLKFNKFKEVWPQLILLRVVQKVRLRLKKKSSIKFGCVLDNGQHWISPMDVGSKLTLWMMMMMIGDF